MAYTGYMCVCGTELFNQSRLCQNLNAGLGPDGLMCNDCCPCPDLDKGLGYPNGYSPYTSPWYDPAEPDSADFAGLLVTSITGLEPGKYTRTVTPNAGVGSVIGQPVQAAPQIVVTGLLMANTCCGMEFGYRWLRSVLQGACGASCSGCDITFLSCEPQFPDEDCGPVDFVADLSPYYRTFKGGALIDGPTITQTIPRACPDCYECGIYEVQFTLSASDPCMYRDPVRVVDQMAFTKFDLPCIEWVDNSKGDQDCSECTSTTTKTCATDPNCTDTSPPSMPSLTSTCFSDCDSDSEYRVCFNIPATTFPGSTSEGTLTLDIFAGSAAMRSVKVKVWENPLGTPADQLSDCDACSIIGISYIPPDGTLTVDGTTKTATISCPGGTSVRANPFISTPGTSANFSYPSFAGCSEMFTVCVTTPFASPTATVTADAVAKEC